MRALIEYVPDLPTYEEVMSGGLQLTQRITDPFERDMNALDSILTWEYCNGKGVPLDEAQLKGFGYSLFIECYIRYNVLDYPE